MWQFRVEIEYYSVAYFDCIQSAVSLTFRYEQGSYVVCSCVDRCCIYNAGLSTALNESSETQHFECSDMFEIYDRMIFDFYMRQPHIP